MSQLANWFERRFDLSFPVELFPNIKARVRGTPARLEELLRGVSAQAVTAKTEGKGAAQEDAGHLRGFEALWPARLNDYLKGAERLTAADLQNRKTGEANHNGRS